MSRLLSLALLCAISAEAGLIAPEYALVKCEEFAGGCPSEPTLVPPAGPNVDYGALYMEFVAGGPYTPPSVNAEPVDSANEWVIGSILNADYAWDTAFVYHPDLGIICCVADFPFRIHNITEDGYLLGNYYDEYSAGFLSHVSVLDQMPANLFASVNVRNAAAHWVSFHNSYFYERDASGRIYGIGMWLQFDPIGEIWSSDYGRFVLSPASDIHAPEPGSLALTALGVVGLSALAARRRRANRVR